MNKVLAVLALTLAALVAGCTPGGGAPAASPPPSPTAAASPSPSATPAPLPASVSCTGSKRTAASMVVAGNQLWDSTIPTAPVSLCTFSGSQLLRFASAHEVSYILDANRGQLVRLNLDSGVVSTLALAAAPKQLAQYAWSPDGTRLTYWVFNEVVSTGANNNSYQAFLKVGSAAATMLTEDTIVPGRGISPADNINVVWAPSGGYVAIVNTLFNAPHLQVFKQDGTSAFPALGEEQRGASMATWATSGDLLYFSDTSTLRSWAPPDTVSPVAGVNIYYPTACPGGCGLAYTVRDPNTGSAKVHVQSAAAGDSDQVQRSVGAFVAANHLWYYAEEPNPAGGLAPPFRQSGKLYDYNIVSKLETQLPLSVTISDTVFPPGITDVWPRS